MTAQALVELQVDQAAQQIRRALAGLEEKDWDKKINEQTMSASETVEHLAECCLAAAQSFSGQPHNWGVYSIPDKSPESLLKAWEEERMAMKEAFAADPSEENCRHITDYVVLHDAYHVGQLCSLRLTLDSSWDPYSIYRS